jgi:hypothetical protein
MSAQRTGGGAEREVQKDPPAHQLFCMGAWEHEGKEHISGWIGSIG